MFCCQKGFPETPETPPLYALDVTDAAIYSYDDPAGREIIGSARKASLDATDFFILTKYNNSSVALSFNLNPLYNEFIISAS